MEIPKIAKFFIVIFFLITLSVFLAVVFAANGGMKKAHKMDLKLEPVSCRYDEGLHGQRITEYTSLKIHL